MYQLVNVSFQKATIQVWRNPPKGSGTRHIVVVSDDGYDCTCGAQRHQGKNKTGTDKLCPHAAELADMLDIKASMWNWREEIAAEFGEESSVTSTEVYETP